MRRNIALVGAGLAVGVLLAGCNNKPDDVEAAVSSASSVQSSVMASVESEASSAVAEAHAALEQSRNDAFVGTGAPIPAPADFDPLGTGHVFAGDYVVTAHTVDQLRDAYASVGDTAQFQLGALEPLAADRTVNVYTDAAAVSVYLPSNVPVRLHCNAVNAFADCGTGSFNSQTPGGVLTLNIETRGGDIAAIQS